MKRHSNLTFIEFLAVIAIPFPRQDESQNGKFPRRHSRKQLGIWEHSCS